MSVVPRIASVLALSVGVWALPITQESAAVFQGEAVERFLADADIVSVRDLGEGITEPQKVTLELDGVTHLAVFKDIDDSTLGFRRMRDGTVVMNFQDSYRLEIAAYRVDRIIGLGMVPATVERTVRRHTGSLQWWVDGMNEGERVDRDIQPPDPEGWAQAVLRRRLFDQLIDNSDRHLNNLLITKDFQLCLIDHSRSFTAKDELRYPARLTRFSRSLLEGIRRLEFDGLKERLGRYLRDDQIRALVARRDAILERARQRVAAAGEEAVLYK